MTTEQHRLWLPPLSVVGPIHHMVPLAPFIGVDWDCISEVEAAQRQKPLAKPLVQSALEDQTWPNLQENVPRSVPLQ